MSTSGNWSTEQLAEFLAAVSAQPDGASAARRAVERAAESLDAEVGVVMRDGEIVTTVGFPKNATPLADIRDVIADRAGSMQVPGVGSCVVAIAPLSERCDGRLMVARSGSSGFDRTEVNLLRAMGKALALTISSIETLEAERAARELGERHAEENAELARSLSKRNLFVEELLIIQRSISHRAPLEAVLDAIVRAAARLLGDEVAGLRLVAPADPGSMVLVSATGLSPEAGARGRRMSTGVGAGGLAYTEGRLVVVDDYTSWTDRIEVIADDGVKAAIAAPVHESGVLVGSLSVGSRRTGRRFDKSDKDTLLAFAEHASLALTDAKTVETLHEALHDALTGLPNRALFFDQLEAALHESRSRRSPLAVLFVDLDHFKNVNDSLGHAAGDELLIAVAQRIRGCLRDEDTAARLGGDEFGIIIETFVDMDDVTSVADRIIEALREPIAVVGKEVFVSASIGIATSGQGMHDGGFLVRNADLAMYKAKGAGRGRFAMFEAGMHADALDRLELEADLRRALERDEFRVFYQPIVNLEDGAIVGTEGLIRWMHPTRGVVAPQDFIPLAEETGLIVPIGRWVIEEVCRQGAKWAARAPATPHRMSVNLSPRQFQDARIVSHVRQALELSGFDAPSLTIEITESALMQDTDGNIRKLHELKDLGVLLAIDDFGTGYSSLSYLLKFPIDILKIDRSFVRNIANGTDDATLVRAILKMGNTLNLELVAEGIEDSEQVASLLGADCVLGQGFYFARPAPAEEVERRFVVKHPRARRLSMVHEGGRAEATG